MSEFEQADRAVRRAAVAIERAVATMLAATQPLERVALDYIIERLIDELMKRNPEVLDYLNKKSGAATMRVANALADWRDIWVDR